jgi:hypothetical protein
MEWGCLGVWCTRVFGSEMVGVVDSWVGGGTELAHEGSIPGRLDRY